MAQGSSQLYARFSCCDKPPVATRYWSMKRSHMRQQAVDARDRLNGGNPPFKRATGALSG